MILEMIKIDNVVLPDKRRYMNKSISKKSRKIFDIEG